MKKSAINVLIIVFLLLTAASQKTQATEPTNQKTLLKTIACAFAKTQNQDISCNTNEAVEAIENLQKELEISIAEQKNEMWERGTLTEYLWPRGRTVAGYTFFSALTLAFILPILPNENFIVQTVYPIINLTFTASFWTWVLPWAYGKLPLVPNPTINLPKDSAEIDSALGKELREILWEKHKIKAPEKIDALYWVLGTSLGIPVEAAKDNAVLEKQIEILSKRIKNLDDLMELAERAGYPKNEILDTTVLEIQTQLRNAKEFKKSKSAWFFRQKRTQLAYYKLIELKATLVAIESNEFFTKLAKDYLKAMTFLDPISWFVTEQMFIDLWTEDEFGKLLKTFQDSTPGNKIEIELSGFNPAVHAKLPGKDNSVKLEFKLTFIRNKATIQKTIELNFFSKGSTAKEVLEFTNSWKSSFLTQIHNIAEELNISCDSLLSKPSESAEELPSVNSIDKKEAIQARDRTS